MSTAKARKLPFLLAGPVLAGLAGASGIAGCSHDWDAYDPRIGGSGGAGNGGTATSAGGSTTSTGGSTTSTGGSTTSTGGGGAGGGTGGVGGGPVKCGGTSALTEDFAGAPLDFWVENITNGGSVAQVAGEMVSTLPSNNPNQATAYLVSTYYYDLRQDAVSVEVTSTTDPSSTAWTLMSVGPNNSNDVTIFLQGGTIEFQQEIGGAETSLKSMPFDPIAHHFWRIREDGTNVNYETSPDGTDWTTQTKTLSAGLFALDFVRVRVGGGTPSGQATPGEPHFDHLNGGGVPKEKYCPIDTITDDFDDGMDSIQWARSNQDAMGMLGEDSGQLVIHYVPNTFDFCEQDSAYGFDLTDSSIVVEVPLPPDASTDTQVSLELNGPGDDDALDNDVEIFLVGGQLKFDIVNAATYQQIGSVLFDPVEHRWWRIREASNTLYWETAPDGKSWTTQVQLSPVPIPLSPFEVELSGGTNTQLAAPGEARFDNVNLPPP